MLKVIFRDRQGAATGFRGVGTGVWEKRRGVAKDGGIEEVDPDNKSETFKLN